MQLLSRMCRVRPFQNWTRGTNFVKREWNSKNFSVENSDILRHDFGVYRVNDLMSSCSHRSVWHLGAPEMWRLQEIVAGDPL